MEHLDDFFKGKMEGRNFEMKDDYWADMEKMMDQKRRKRRFVIWWWSKALVLILASVVALWLFWPISTPQIQAFPIPGLGEEYVLENTPSTIDESENTLANETAVDSESPLNTNASVAKGVPTKNLHHPSDFDHSSVLKNAFNDSQYLSAFTQGVRSVIPVLTPIKPKNATWSPPVKPLAMLSLLPVLENEKNGLDTLGLAILMEVSSPWSFELEGGATMYPYFDGGSRSIGGMAGGIVSYAINPDWSLLAGINYRYRTGSFDFAKTTTITNYRFGVEEQSYFLLPEALHYLELPVLVRKTWGRHELDAGARLSYLLGIQGSLESSFAGEGRPDNTQEVQSGWLAQDGFVTWHMDIVAGYAFRVHPRFAVWTKVNYTVPGLLDGNYPSPFGLQLQESKPVFIDLGLRFYLND